MIDAKWTRRNNLFIISQLAEAQRAADMLTRLSGKADGRMWMWEEEGVCVCVCVWRGLEWQGMGLGGQVVHIFINLLPSVNQVKHLDSYLAHYKRERRIKLFGFQNS